MARPLEEALDRIGDRWTLLVVDALLAGPQRFGELADQLGGIAPNILTKRLRQLEGDGLVVAAPYTRRPVRLSYQLTAQGRDLAAALSLLSSWGSRHHGGDRPEGDDVDAGHHAACGSPVEVRLWCPTCDRVVDDDESSSDITL
jgi:DNA-binding HxlR family transcriptional regulator